VIWRVGGRRPWDQLLWRLGAPPVASCGRYRFGLFGAPAAGALGSPVWGGYVPLATLLASADAGGGLMTLVVCIAAHSGDPAGNGAVFYPALPHERTLPRVGERAVRISSL